MGQYKTRRLIRSRPQSNNVIPNFHARRAEPALRLDALDSSSTPANNATVPRNVVIIVVVVISILLIISLSALLVLYLRRRKRRQMETTTQTSLLEKRSLDDSVTSKMTGQTLAYPPVLLAHPLMDNYNRVMMTQGRVQNVEAIPRSAVKAPPVPASLMPRLRANSGLSTPALPSMLIPELNFSRSPSPNLGVQPSLAQPGQTLKVVNTTPSPDSDLVPVPHTLGEHSRKMSYTDLPRIRTDLIKSNGKITVPPSKPQRQSSSGNASITSKASSHMREPGTASSGNSRPQGPRPLPNQRGHHPGSHERSKTMDFIL